MNKKEWKLLFIEKSKTHYSRGHDRRADTILRMISNAKANITTRSKKDGVWCDLTLDQLRQLTLDNIYTKDKYFPDRIVTHHNMNFDHILPMYHGGESTINNIQLITKFSNQLKFLWTEDELKMVLDAVEFLPDAMLKDVLKRLASNKY